MATYAHIGPNVSDLIRTVTAVVTPLGTNTFNAPQNQVNKRVPAVGNGGTGTSTNIIVNEAFDGNVSYVAGNWISTCAGSTLRISRGGGSSITKSLTPTTRRFFCSIAR